VTENVKATSASNPNSRNFGAQPHSGLELEAGRDAAYQGGKNTSEVVEVVSNEFAAALWQRVEAFVPATILSRGDYYSDRGATWRATCVIPTFRFMRYGPGQAFKPHQDPSRLAGSDPRSGASGRFRSLVTLALYLNDAEEFEGGGLHFVHLVPNPEPTGKAMISAPTATVMPKRSRCVIFEHRLQHESEAITAGVKHMVQCDVLYELELESPSAG
jgi:predicted 2-oxoglutarate/Fe(II)-dependent dioxygenase YbiX